MRVALGELARQYLNVFGVTVTGYVVQVGDVRASDIMQSPDIKNITRSAVRCPDPEASLKMVRRIDRAQVQGDTRGGVLRCKRRACQWVWKITASRSTGSTRASAPRFRSIQTLKSVNIGNRIASAGYVGSRSHDTFELEQGVIKRGSNCAGGIECGMSNGGDIFGRDSLEKIQEHSKHLSTAHAVFSRQTHD
ncbi:MAG: chorismate synthase [Candidatus Eremiobacteraeota bacterium]|nr:chorismate synthase [Candidatus Eremiobacteraeota bacterium]